MAAALAAPEESPATVASYVDAFDSQAAPTADGASTGAGADAAGSDGDAEYGARSTPGRAARRRQLAQWKKNRRRAAAATAVALVGGGLTIAALPSGTSTGHAPAAAAPEPVVPTASRMSTTDATSAPPTASPSSHPPTSPSAVPGAQQHTTVSVAPAAPDTATALPPAPAAYPTATATAPPHPMAAAPGGTHSVVSPPPQTSAPVSTGYPGAATPSANPTPNPQSPVHVCLLVLCVG
ncbi:hypothetical protein NON19_11855 [Streptomyces rubrisoli]|uniref:Uncharacterized protein n=1 Tax=Streptantibioticus rubrisoli TaxID=1387313 RepID=A0ABT1PBF8_9ACTN|nr:hypothetical protein [Streptantibioticus rubrisoli]